MEGTQAEGLRKAGDGDGDEGAAENATVAIADITDIKKELDEMKYTQEAERQRMESAIYNYKFTMEERMDRIVALLQGRNQPDADYGTTQQNLRSAMRTPRAGLGSEEDDGGDGAAEEKTGTYRVV